MEFGTFGRTPKGGLVCITKVTEEKSFVQLITDLKTPPRWIPTQYIDLLGRDDKVTVYEAKCIAGMLLKGLSQEVNDTLHGEG